jgi:AcrR family transcriptional regulator
MNSSIGDPERQGTGGPAAIAERRDAIMTSAKKVFARNGFDATKIADR